MNNLTNKIIAPLLIIGLAGVVNNCATSEGNVILGEFLQASEDPADRAIGKALVTYGMMEHEKEVAEIGKDEIKIYIDQNGQETYGSAIHATGEILQSWLYQNMIGESGERGVNICAKYNIQGNMGFPAMVVALFEDESGNPFPARHGPYRNGVGQVSTASDFLFANKMDYTGVGVAFLPYDELGSSLEMGQSIGVRTALIDISETDPRLLSVGDLMTFERTK